VAQDYTPAGKKKTVDAMKYFVENGGDVSIACGDGIPVTTLARTASKMVPELGILLFGNEEVPVAKPQQVKGKKIGRNEPCTCGSKRKYKVCCGKN
jgi:hypothetical protein